jgi:hypothetical protein
VLVPQTPTFAAPENTRVIRVFFQRHDIQAPKIVEISSKV